MTTPALPKWAILYQGNLIQKFVARNKAENHALALKRLVADATVEICWIGGDDDV